MNRYTTMRRTRLTGGVALACLTALAMTAPVAASSGSSPSACLGVEGCLQLPVQLPQVPSPTPAPSPRMAPQSGVQATPPKLTPPTAPQQDLALCLPTGSHTLASCLSYYETFVLSTQVPVTSPELAEQEQNQSIPSTPAIVRDTIYNAVGQPLRSINGTTYTTVLNGSATATGAPAAAVDTGANAIDNVAQGNTVQGSPTAASSSSGNSGSAGPCEVDDPSRANSDDDFINYGTFASGGKASHGQVYYVFYLFGYDHAEFYNNIWHWQVLACSSGNGHAIDSDGEGWRVDFSGAALAETKAPLHELYGNGTTGAAGPSLTTHLDFKLEYEGLGVTAGVSETQQGNNSWAYGSNGFISVPADGYGTGNEVSTYWDGRGAESRDSMGAAGQDLWEFDESDTATKYIEGDAFLGIKCTDTRNSACNAAQAMWA